MSGAGRAKFRRPGKGAPVVDKEYIVTFKPDTPTAVVDEAARCAVLYPVTNCADSRGVQQA